MQTVKTSFDLLLGKKIGGIYRSADKMQIGFVVDGAKLKWDAVGVCCSHSWFEHLSGVEALIGHTVNAIVEHDNITLDNKDPRKGKETDCERVYGWTFTTERGRADLDMRNDSNGYYGGEAVQDGSYSYGRGYKEDLTVAVEDDF